MKKEGRLTAKDYLKSLGPGAIMAAAIIGPGSITTASTQGASYGYESIWLILIACVIAYFFLGNNTVFNLCIEWCKRFK